MQKQLFPVICGVMTLMVLSAAPSLAASPKLLATNGSWETYVVDEGGSKVCYMASEPTEDKGDYTRRGRIIALITNRPAEGTRNVFSYIAGYPYKPGSDATLKIGDKTFTLFTQDDTAWAPDAAIDDKIAEAMRNGSTMVVKGVSSRGTATVDTFTLKGSGAAHDAMTKECAAQ
jgi:invasion protein IalB